MKAIKKVSLFHKKDYHKRYFKFIFGEEYIKYFDSEKMDLKKLAAAHKRKNLLSCRALEEDEIEAKITERESRRSMKKPKVD